MRVMLHFRSPFPTPCLVKNIWEMCLQSSLWNQFGFSQQHPSCWALGKERMLFWLNLEWSVGLGSLLISGKDIPGVGNSMSDGTDVGTGQIQGRVWKTTQQLRCLAGLGSRRSSDPSSCGWSSPGSFQVGCVTLCGPGASSFPFKPHRFKKKKKK